MIRDKRGVTRLLWVAKLGLNLCEVSILPVEDNTLVAFMRENSGKGWDCYKALSTDGGFVMGETCSISLCLVATVLSLDG